MAVKRFVAIPANDRLGLWEYISKMATRIGRKQAAHLYITEWMDHRGLSDEKAAGRLGIDRTTVWKWRTQPRRLTTDKIASLASVLDLEPQELYRPPGRRSLDAMLSGVPVEEQDRASDMAADILRRFANKAS